MRIGIRGEHFNLFGERHLGRGTALDASFQATIGGVALGEVRWLDSQTLEAEEGRAQIAQVAQGSELRAHRQSR